MKFEDWDPIYSEILGDMGYDRSMDEHSAGLLSELLSSMPPSRKASVDRLHNLIRGKDVLVCGNASILKDELHDMNIPQYCIIAADGATEVLADTYIVPDIIVTDLDGAVKAEIEASRKGAVIVVHAHGDNMGIIREVVPHLFNVIGSTQAAPLHNVYNFGGFTDGDRCVFIARRCGASSITLIGFDFEDLNVSDSKKKKLNWARKLIAMALE